MKIIQLLIVVTVCMLTYNSNAQNKTTQSMQQQIASSIFKGWQTGESGKGYNSFLKYLEAESFQYFSHPLIGKHAGKEAFEKLMALLNEREVKPNQLTFSNIISYQYNNSFCFQFDSEGKVADGFKYQGYNIIQLEIKEGKLIGFREYFGYINPSWFK
ncbi:MAG: hypothetical protein H7Y86_09240 [Rhizobacter sp.]|nr:hypothetical protein [Ferruginibacter sp.]